MPTTALTDAKCRAFKPGEKLTKHFDGQGLHLAVLPSGVKVWRIAYRLAGKPQTMSLGPYPAVSLAEARKKRDEVKAIEERITQAMKQLNDTVQSRREMAPA